MSNLQSGQQLGPYRVLHQIGQGGMAVVYKAYHASMDRYVAIKVLPHQFLNNPESLGRFQQEARTIANLEHLHILPVYDFGESDGVPYLVMRYLDTGTLKDRLMAGPLSYQDIDRIFSQIASALGYAHARGVIHRDIKPANVMLDARGDVFLTDFGVARLLESSVHFTASGAVTGTPAYMSPEQARGEKLDARSDVYALGIVLYEMVTGRVPFMAETPLAVLLKHITEPLPLPSVVKPDIEPAIERVILRALSKNREDRFASCEDFLSAWKDVLNEIALSQASARITEPSHVIDESARGARQAHVKPDDKANIAHMPRQLMPVRWWVVAGIVIVFASMGLMLFMVNTLTPKQPALAPQDLRPTLIPTAVAILATATAIPPTPTATPTPTPTRVPATIDPVDALLQPLDKLWNEGNWAQVIDLLTRARRLDPNRDTVVTKLYSAYYNYGNTLLNQGRRDEARTQFQNALAVNPNGAEAQRALASLMPSPTPPCPAVSGPFAPAWSLAQKNIGCALGGAFTSFVAEENFERGKMFWRESVDVTEVLALFNDGTWQAYKGTQWIEGRPEFSCPSPTTPSRCPPTPKRGFGQAWCDVSANIRNRIGNATDCERGYRTALQRFERGSMLQADNGTIYVLYNTGRWETK